MRIIVDKKAPQRSLKKSHQVSLRGAKRRSNLARSVIANEVKQSRRFILEVATASPRNDFVDCHALRARNDRPKTRLFQRPTPNLLTLTIITGALTEGLKYGIKKPWIVKTFALVAQMDRAAVS